jgi:hypothetical protein
MIVSQIDHSPVKSIPPLNKPPCSWDNTKRFQAESSGASAATAASCGPHACEELIDRQGAEGFVAISTVFTPAPLRLHRET